MISFRDANYFSSSRHMQWEDGVEHPTSDDLAFYCRVCGPNRFFESDSHLQNHIEAMHDRFVCHLPLTPSETQSIMEGAFMRMPLSFVDISTFQE